MATRDLIPSRDEDFNSFQSNLLLQVTGNAVAWQIPAAVITDLATHQTAWQAAWANYIDETKRTKGVTQTKNTVRLTYESSLRKFIQKWIYDNNTMTSANIVDCGLKPRDTTRTPVPVPDTVPVVEFSVMSGHRLKARVTQQPNAEGVTKRAKPKGVANIELVYILNAEGSIQPHDCTHQRFSTKPLFELAFELKEAGARLQGFARWLNTKNQPGPWGDVFNAIVP